MSQEGGNLPMDVEGSSSSGGAGSAGTAGSGSVSSSVKRAAEITSSGSESEPASPAISQPHDVEETEDDSDTSPDEAMPADEGLAGAAGFISSSSASSIKLALASEDSNGSGSEPASPLVAAPAGDSNAGSTKPASPVVALVHAGGNQNNGGSKPASPAAVFGAGESDKGEGKDELAGGEGAGLDDAAGDSGGVAGSNSKSIKSSSDGGDFQGDVVKDAPTPAAGGGGSGSGKGKGKRVEPVGDHALHIWTERERRKKMKNMYSGLHSLLPRLPPKADKASIVGEAVDYIKALEGTLQRLERLKLERRRAQLLLGAGCSRAAPPPPMRHGGAPAPLASSRETTLADMVNNWNAQQAAAAAPPGTFQTWSAPNIAVSVTGNESFISVCAPRQPGVVTKALCVLEKYRIDVVTLNISSDQNRSIFSIHTCINPASAQITQGVMTAEDRYKLAVSELLQYIAK